MQVPFPSMELDDDDVLSDRQSLNDRFHQYGGVSG